MKVKITRRAYGVINGLSLSYYRPGEIYDLPSTLAEYLVMEDYAILEIRDRDSPRCRSSGTATAKRNVRGDPVMLFESP